MCGNMRGVLSGRPARIAKQDGGRGKEPSRDVASVKSNSDLIPGERVQCGGLWNISPVLEAVPPLRQTGPFAWPLPPHISSSLPEGCW